MQAIVINIEQLAQWINGWFLVFVRIAAIFSIAPVFGSRLIPARIRALTSFVIALAVFPALPPAPHYDALSFTGLMLVLQQLMLGIGAGFIVQLVFNAVTLAGEVIAMTMGLGFAQMVDPQNGIQVPVLSQFYVIVATLLFLSFNGHVMLLGLVVQSFVSMPLAVWQFDAGFVWQLLQWTSHMFTGAVAVAIPVITALLLVNVTMGVMTRSAPQLNIFAVGFPVAMLAGFVLLLLSMPLFAPLFAQLNDEGFDFIRQLLGM